MQRREGALVRPARSFGNCSHFLKRSVRYRDQEEAKLPAGQTRSLYKVLESQGSWSWLQQAETTPGQQGAVLPA